MAGVGLFLLSVDPRRSAAGKDVVTAGHIGDLARALDLEQVVLVRLGADVAGEEMAEVAGLACRMIAVPAPGRAAALAGLVDALARREPAVLGQALFLSPGVTRQVSGIVEQVRPTILVFDTIRTYTARLARGRTLVLYDDLLSDRYAAAPAGDPASLLGRYRAAVGRLAPLGLATRLAGPLRRLEAGLCRRKEAYVARRAPGLILNAAEAARLNARAGATSVRAYVPGLDGSPEPVRRGGEAPFWLFVGALAHGPNQEALDWLAEQVLPAYRRRGGGVPIRVAGEHGAWAPDNPYTDDDLKLLGHVPDLGALYAACIGVVIPVATGSGVRVKLLEALAAGCPVVATPGGLRPASTALPHGVDMAATPDRLRPRHACLRSRGRALQCGGGAPGTTVGSGWSGSAACGRCWRERGRADGAGAPVPTCS